MSTMLCKLPSETYSLTGGFHSYLNYVFSIPMLSEEEEKSYFLRYQEENDLEAAQKIVLAHLRYVASIAKRYMGYGLPMEDLVQEGSVGLMKSVQRFDLSHGVRLSSFAIHWIKAEIHEYIICNWRLVKIATTRAQRKLFFKLRNLKKSIASLDNNDTQEIAQRLNVKASDVSEMETRLKRNDSYFDESFCDSIGEENDSFKAKSGILEDEHSDPERQLIRQDYLDRRTEAMRRAINMLDSRSRDIVESRWLREPEDKHNLKILAEKYAISIERVRQIEAKALVKIKNSIDMDNYY